MKKKSSAWKAKWHLFILMGKVTFGLATQCDYEIFDRKYGKDL